MLLLADLVGLLSAYVLTRLLFPAIAVGSHEDLWKTGAFAFTLPIWILLAKVLGLYDRDEERTDHSTADDLPGVFHLVTAGTWLLILVRLLTPYSNVRVERMLVFWMLAIILIMCCRAAARAYCRRHISFIQNTVIVGAGKVGQQIAHKFMTHPEYGVNVVGFVDDEPMERRADLENIAILGSPEQLPELVELLEVERVVVAFSNTSSRDSVALLRSLNTFEVQVDLVPRFYDLVSPGVDIHSVEGLPLIGLRPGGLSRSSQLLKRAFDLVVAAPLIVLLLPLGLVVALAIKLDSKGSVFFRQPRVGAGDRVFRIWKFRTMVEDAESMLADVAHLNRHLESGDDALMFKADADPRVTRVGRVLRRWSLDEVPQLLNVLAGQMSLVGPRPLVVHEAEHVAGWGRRRLDIRPGMTGLWQVLGRNEIPFDEMVKLDYVYVTTWSLRQDLQILLRTIPVVFGRRGM
jgi:exopolysaccharide biosynthesis polyprenyl glycosylphosphotransferase